MRDQASHLRSLVLRSMREHAAELGLPTRLVVITGGQKSVGTTTVAANMATALAENGSRVVLTDANLAHPEIAGVCGLRGTENVADVLAGRRDIHEVLQRGPAGIQVVAGTAESPHTFSPVAVHRLIKQLKTLGRHADVVIVDVGTGSAEVARSFWEAADQVVLVSTAEDEAVKAAYATVKQMTMDDVRPTIHFLLNRVDSAGTALDVHERMSRCAREHLQIELQYLGFIPTDRQVSRRCDSDLSSVVTDLNGPSAREFRSVTMKMFGNETGPLANVA